MRKDVARDPVLQPERTDAVSQAEIAARAYELWQSRGCPVGSPELDWFQAEADLRMVKSHGSHRQVHFETEQKDDLCIVRISGRFATGADSDYVAMKTRALKSLGCRKLVADIRELVSVGSEGIGFFVELHTSLANLGGRFVLAGPTTRVLEVLTLTGLIPIMHIATNMDGALSLAASA